MLATISTGGAANGVSVPPMETLTNSTPSVAYLSLFDTAAENTRSRSISAPRVMAAGSVMSEPSRGTRASVTKYTAMPPRSGTKALTASTSRRAAYSTARLPATTMIANTNIGSVKLRSAR